MRTSTGTFRDEAAYLRSWRAANPDKVARHRESERLKRAARSAARRAAGLPAQIPKRRERRGKDQEQLPLGGERRQADQGLLPLSGVERRDGTDRRSTAA